MTRQQSVRWFDAGERKPPDHKNVLLSDGESVTIGFYCKSRSGGDDWVDMCGDSMGIVTHWMFLPLPPNAVVVETGAFELPPDEVAFLRRVHDATWPQIWREAQPETMKRYCEGLAEKWISPREGKE